MPHCIENNTNLLSGNLNILTLNKAFISVRSGFISAKTIIRHFSHVNKSGIFKNLKIRRKANRNFRCILLESHFKHPKLYWNISSWFARSCCHMDTFWKKKDQSSHYWQGKPRRLFYVGFHHQRDLNSRKQVLCLI